MRILFLVGDLDRPTGHCVKTVARYLVDKGEYVIILAEKYRNNDVDFCKAECVSNNTVFYNNRQGLVKRSLLKNLNRIKALLLSPMWPFTSLIQPHTLLKYSSHIVKRENIDTVIAVNYSFNSIYAGHKLKKCYRINYIAYFLDGCFAGPCPRFFSNWIKDKLALFWENKMISNADGVVMMKSAENKYFSNKNKVKFYNKIEFLDIPLYQPQKKENVVRTQFPTNQKIIFYAGGMLRNIRPPHYFLNLFASLKNNDVHLYIAGRTDYQDLVDKICNESKNVHYLGIIDFNKVQIMLKEADYLLNIGNNLQGMVPSKIFEYMSLGKPIISTYRLDNDTSYPYIKKYGISLLIDERRDINENIIHLRSFLSKDLNGGCCITDNLFYNNTPECFMEYLSSYNSN